MEELVGAFAAYLRAERNRSALTVRNYELALREFRQFRDTLSSPWQWSDVTADDLREWLLKMVDEEGKQPATVNLALSALRTFFRYLMQTGQVSHNPCAKVSAPKKDKRLPAFIREGALDCLLDQVAFAPGFIGVRNRFIVLLLYMTGIRRAEALALKDGDIRLAQRQMLVTGKGDKQRLIPFGPDLEQELRHYLKARDSAFGPLPACTPLLLSDKGRPLSAVQFGRIVKDTLAQVTLQQRRSPHVLRHTFATTMLNHGADLQAIQQLLGHRSLETTQIYTHLSFEDLKQEYQRAHPRS